MDSLEMLWAPATHDDGVYVYEDTIIDGAWYRYEDRYEYDRHEIWLRQLRVIRETPKGVWLDDWSVPRFVLNDAKKRFAYPTIELARKSFLIRKRKQLGYLSAQHDHIAIILKKAEELFA